LATRFSVQPKGFRLRINREGLFLYLLLFAIGFAAYNTGNNLLFIFVSVMATLSVTHTLFNYVSREKNSVDRRLPSSIHAGQPFNVTLQLKNNKRFFSTFSAVLEEEHPELRTAGGGVHFVHVPAGKTLERRYETTLHRRGRYRFDGLWLYCRYPFGLTRHGILYPAEQEVIVYPRLVPVRTPPSMQPRSQGDRERPEKGFGFSLYGLREYQEGESSRFIHWKTSAKWDQLMVKEFEDEQRRHVILLFENRGNPNLLFDEPFEAHVSEAASLAAHFIRDGWQVELVTLSGSIPHGSGAAHLRRIFHHLALIKAAPVSADQAHRRLLEQLHPDAGHLVPIGGDADSPDRATAHVEEVAG